MVKDAIDAIESLSCDNMFIEQALIQIAFALIFKLHVAFGGDFPEAAVARHNDKPLKKMGYWAGIDSHWENQFL